MRVVHGENSYIVSDKKVMSNVKKGAGCNFKFRISAIALAVQLVSAGICAGPSGGSVVGGAGNISHDGNATTINQLTDRMAINWQSYDVNASERVQYIQPSSSSVSLNRILSNRGSEIHGKIDANGRVFLINPNGIVFGRNAQVNVGGMLASGLDINPSDFMNGDFVFSALDNTDGAILNSGLINASIGGSVSLLGKQVGNDGLIVANLGAVNLSAGKEAVVTFDNDGLMGVRITREVLQDELGVDAAVINSGEITAENGRILLSGSVSEDIFSQAINVHGEAKSVVVHNDGSFTLGGGADVVNTGGLVVSGNDVSPGQVVLLGENVTSSGNIVAEGGDIELHANDTTVLADFSVTNAASHNDKGGTVKLLGQRVGVFGNSEIDVSGDGGGRILVGGDKQGGNRYIPSAEILRVEKNVSLRADGFGEGNGGEIVNWATDSNWFSGFVSASSLYGDGGFIEISASSLRYDGIVNVKSLHGNAGTLFFDPENVIIGDTDTDNTKGDSSGFDFDLGSGNFYISSAKFGYVDSNSDSNSNSNSNSNGFSGHVRIEASNNIVVENSKTISLHDNTDIDSLTFIADAENYHNAEGALSASGNLTGDLSNAGAFIMESGSKIETKGVPLTINAAAIQIETIHTGMTDTGSRVNTSDNSMLVRSNGLSLTATTGAINVNGDLSSKGWHVTGDVNGDTGGDITLNAATSIKVLGDILTYGSSADRDEDGTSDGGSGGHVILMANSEAISVGDIHTDGGNPYVRNSLSADGANAGNIYISANGGDGAVNLSGNLLAQGGRHWGTGAGIQNGLGGDIVIEGNVTLGDDITVDTRLNSLWMSGNHPDVTLLPTGGDVIITGTVNNAHTLNVYGKHVNFMGDVGSAATPLTALNIGAYGNVAFGYSGDPSNPNPVVLGSSEDISFTVDGAPPRHDFTSPTNLATTFVDVVAGSFSLSKTGTFSFPSEHTVDAADIALGSIPEANTFQAGNITTSSTNSLVIIADGIIGSGQSRGVYIGNIMANGEITIFGDQIRTLDITKTGATETLTLNASNGAVDTQAINATGAIDIDGALVRTGAIGMTAGASGSVNIHTSDGAITTGNIDAHYADITIASVSTNTVDGSITVADINSGSMAGSGDGGTVDINAAGKLQVGSIYTAGFSDVQSGDIQGTAGGSVTLKGSQVIVTGTINSSGLSSADTLDDNSEYDGGDAGDVTITSGSTLAVAGLIADGGNGHAFGSNNNDEADGGDAGSISLSANSGSSGISLGGNIFMRSGRLYDNNDAGSANGVAATLTFNANLIQLRMM